MQFFKFKKFLYKKKPCFGQGFEAFGRVKIKVPHILAPIRMLARNLEF